MMNKFIKKYITKKIPCYIVLMVVLSALSLSGCADVDVPGARNLNVPSPTAADIRPEALNEKPDSVLHLPLGDDVLIPQAPYVDPLPNEMVGPYELRSETLAGALQLILADYEVPLAFETEEGLTRTITVTNLRGPLNRVVTRVCGLADLYCAFEDGILIVKDAQTFTVTVPPIGGDTDILGALADGLAAITGSQPITETATRTIIYQATHRTASLAERYFQKMRANTALIVFQIYIWEVELNSLNDTGINWEKIDTLGKFNVGIQLPGSVGTANPVSIGLPTTQDAALGAGDVLEFISNYGAVKSISQPQITVLSGTQASLRAAETRNYISALTRSVEDGEVTVSTETDSVDSGFTMTISSAWNNATVYGTIEIELQEFLAFEQFDLEDGGELRLPNTIERELSTQIRIRPGDSLLIAGIIRERDQFDENGPGFKQPILPLSRRAEVSNSELVFLIKPHVIVFTSEEHGGAGMPAHQMPAFEPIPDANFEYYLSPTQNHPEASVRNTPKPVESFPVDVLNPSGRR